MIECNADGIFKPAIFHAFVFVHFKIKFTYCTTMSWISILLQKNTKKQEDYSYVRFATHIFAIQFWNNLVCMIEKWRNEFIFD